MSTAFRILLDGSQQVPAVVSSASGLGAAIFDSAAVTLGYTLNIQGLDWGAFTGQQAQTVGVLDDVIDGHFHAAARGVNGSVVLNWKFGDADDFAVSEVLADGSRTLSGTWELTDSAVPPLSSFAAELGNAALGSDVGLYANVHTNANSGGEIRGQLVAIATDNGEIVGGTPGDDILPALGGDDHIQGGAGNDTIDGGAGADTSNYAGAHTDYLIYTKKAFNGVATTTVKDSVGTDGTDTLSGVETLHFSDVDISRFGAQQNLTMNVDGASFDDVVYRSVSTGQIIYQNMNAGVAAGFDAITTTLPGWTAIGTGDVSGDGKADVFIWNSTTGYVYAVLPGASAAPAYTAVGGGLTGNYSAIGAADIDGNGLANLLVRDANSGSIFWQFGPISAMDYVGVNLGSNWTYRAAGDVNRDGYADVVIQHTSGQVYVANMADAHNSGYIDLGNIAGYQVRTVADVNADGYADVIVQRDSDGWTLWRDLSGTGPAWNVASNPVGTSWIVKDAADVDNDGSVDLIYQHATTGETYYRAMDNGVGTGWGVVSSPVGTEWLVV